MEIDYINGPKTEKIFGMSKYQMEIIKRLDIEMNVIEYESIMHNMEKIYNTRFPSKSPNVSFKIKNENSTKSTEENKLFEFFTEIGRNTFKLID